MVNEDIYADLRRQALGWLVILIGAGTWVGLLAADLFSQNLPSEWVGCAVATTSICCVLYTLRTNHLQLACYIAVTCMWISNALIASYSPHPVFLYLFGLVIVLSSSLIKHWATSLLALSSTVIIVLMAEPHLELGPLINTWGSLIAGVVISRGLYKALETINRHHDYAVEQMNLARDHRGQLVKLTKALQETSEALRHANIQLRFAREAADDARRLKAQFAANVSHELRTPINLVIGYSEVMVMAPEVYGAPLPPAYRSDIQAIYRNAKHLQDLINDILDIAQIEASRLAITKVKTEIRHTVLEAAEMIRDVVAAKGLRFNLEIPFDLPEVWIDRTRIRQVILNLLANAVRFTDEGSIALNVSHDNENIMVSVKDTGIGISKDNLGRVFEEFYQTENSLSKKQMGTGLGLTLSMHVVQYHGGRLWAESAGIAGQGSAFSFTLPTSAASKQIISHSVSRTDAGRNPKCVIIFDEDAAIGQLFKRYLNKHEVMISPSQDDVIRLTQLIKPSAIVIDRNRNQDEIKTLLVNCSRDTAIISCPMPSVRRATQAFGVVGYLVKPITRQVLIDAIVALEKPVHRILIVDDERDVARMLIRMLQSHHQGYEVWHANNGEDGLAMMGREHPDVVLLDIQMPGMDGFSVIHKMKRDPILQHIPVIIASAHSAEGAIMSDAEGVISVIRPNGFSPDELVNCVEAVVNVLTPSTVLMPQGS